MPEPLLASKLQPPRLRSSLVARPRLIARLQAGREGKLTVVAAPAGSGKTTLVRQWLADGPGVAWVSLEPDDSDPVRFWRYVISACQGFDPRVGSESLLQLEVPFSIQSGLRPLLTVFVNELACVEHTAVLVLEDYHAIVAEQIHADLMFVLEHLPESVHLVLISRGSPPLPLARLRASGELTEIGASDLRFDGTEASALLEHASGASLAEADVTRIHVAFEGWAAGLRLLGLALQSDADGDVVTRILSDSGPHGRELTEYFLAEVVQTQPPAVQEFILRTSFLDRLTASLCEVVTDRPDCADLLAHLEQRNVFLEALDGPGGWYRYHALFASAMRLECRRRLGDATVADVLRRASSWYVQHGMLPEAIDAAFGAGETSTAVELIQLLIHQHYASKRQEAPFPPNLHALERWLPQVPSAELERRPLVSFGLAAALFFTPLIGMRPTTTFAVDDIERLLANAERGFAESRETRALGRVLGFRAMLAQQRGLASDGGRWAGAALDLLDETDLVWRNICLCVVGAADMHAGRIFAAADRFTEARQLCEPGGPQAFMRVSTGLLAWAILEQGDVRWAAALFQGLLSAARQGNDVDDVGRALHGLAEISLWQNDLDDASARAEEVLDVAREFPHAPVYVHAGLMLARVDLARGQADAALARCEALLAQRPPLGDMADRHLQAEVELQEAAIALHVGAIARVRRWADARYAASPLRERAQLDREQLLLARLDLFDGDAVAARGRAEAVLESAQAEGRGRVALEARTVLALARAAAEQLSEATVVLIEALDAAESVEARRVFVGEGPRMAALLRSTLANVHDPRVAAFARSLLRTADRSESLSARELEVLRLLAAGRDNAAIARELVVSLNTVKAHVKAIYRKLAVSNRAEAVAVARDLRLA